MNGIKILKDIKNYNENLKDGQKKILLDINRTSKFNIINKKLENEPVGIYRNKNTYLMSTDSVVLLLSTYVIFDTVCQFINTLRVFNKYIEGNSNDKNDQFLVKQGNNYYVLTNEDKPGTKKYAEDDSSVSNTKTYFLVYNILILFLVAQLLNNEEWLIKTGLVTTESKKYLY